MVMPRKRPDYLTNIGFGPTLDLFRALKSDLTVDAATVPTGFTLNLRIASCTSSTGRRRCKP